MKFILSKFNNNINSDYNNLMDMRRETDNSIISIKFILLINFN